MKIKHIITCIALLGLVLIVIGSFEKRARQDVAFNAEVGHPTQDTASSELAQWLVHEGRARLRFGMIAAAQDAAKLSSILDINSGGAHLALSIQHRQSKLAQQLAMEASEAMKAGDLRRLARARSLQRRLATKGESDDEVHKTREQ